MPAETPAQLPYAKQPLVGHVIIDRRDDTLTITFLRETGRVVLNSVWTALGLTSVGCGIALSPLVARTGEGKGVFIFLLLSMGASWLIKGVGGVVGAFQQTVLSLDGEDLTLRRRTLRQIERQTWKRAWIKDVGIARLGFGDTLTRPWVLRATLSGGQPVNLVTGREQEVRAAADALREVAGLPAEGWLESPFPKRPKRSPVERVIGVRTLSVTLPAPAVAWRFILPAAPILLVISYWIVGIIDAAPGDHWRIGRWNTAWIPLQILLIWCLGVAGLGALIHNMTPRVTIEVKDGRLIWSEASLLHPGQDDWPLDRIGDVAVVARGAGRRAALVVHIEGIGPTELIRNSRRRDIDYIADMLRVGIIRDLPPRTATGAIGAESPSKP